jgi:hypothetical protein
MIFDNPLSLVRQLKGAPLSVFIVCQIVRTVVTQHFLCEQTGYSDFSVTRALSYLTEHNFLARVTGGWMIATAAQLPLMATLPDGEGELIENDFQKNRVKRDFGPADDVVNDESEGSQKNKSTSLTNSRENRVKRDSCSGGKVLSVKTLVKDQAEIDECLAVLRDAGIFGKRAADIAESNHVTVEYIQAHLAQVANESWDNPLGMAIWRMGQGMPAPVLQENGHVDGCRCEECNIANATRRYTSGKYGEYLTSQSEEEDIEGG